PCLVDLQLRGGAECAANLQLQGQLFTQFVDNGQPGAEGRTEIAVIVIPRAQRKSGFVEKRRRDDILGITSEIITDVVRAGQQFRVQVGHAVFAVCQLNGRVVRKSTFAALHVVLVKGQAGSQLRLVADPVSAGQLAAYPVGGGDDREALHQGAVCRDKDIRVVGNAGFAIAEATQDVELWRYLVLLLQIERSEIGIVDTGSLSQKIALDKADETQVVVALGRKTEISGGAVRIRPPASRRPVAAVADRRRARARVVAELPFIGERIVDKGSIVMRIAVGKNRPFCKIQASRHGAFPAAFPETGIQLFESGVIAPQSRLGVDTRDLRSFFGDDVDDAAERIGPV